MKYLIATILVILFTSNLSCFAAKTIKAGTMVKPFIDAIGFLNDTEGNTYAVEITRLENNKFEMYTKNNTANIIPMAQVREAFRDNTESGSVETTNYFETAAFKIKKDVVIPSNKPMVPREFLSKTIKAGTMVKPFIDAIGFLNDTEGNTYAVEITRLENNKFEMYTKNNTANIIPMAEVREAFRDNTESSSVETTNYFETAAFKIKKDVVIPSNKPMVPREFL
uniref:GLPGLI family protein n=1 Tax=Rhabditophanes sp. KR3021 TaxID=114890 RepID=A0AC35TLF3_9BILA